MLRKVTADSGEKRVVCRESFEEFVEDVSEATSRSQWKESVTVHSSEGELVSKQEYAQAYKKGFEQSSASSAAANKHSLLKPLSSQPEKSSVVQKSFVSHSGIHLHPHIHESSQEKSFLTDVSTSEKQVPQAFFNMVPQENGYRYLF